MWYDIVITSKCNEAKSMSGKFTLLNAEYSSYLMLINGTTILNFKLGMNEVLLSVQPQNSDFRRRLCWHSQLGTLEVWKANTQQHRLTHVITPAWPVKFFFFFFSWELLLDIVKLVNCGFRCCFQNNLNKCLHIQIINIIYFFKWEIRQLQQAAQPGNIGCVVHRLL